jgi:hypothetical protein
MRDFDEPDLAGYRVNIPTLVQMYGEIILTNHMGAFLIPFNGNDLRILASRTFGWDHISVSLADRVPDWYEMEYIAKLFFKENEVAVQFHVPEEKHVNIHPNCLHWWRDQDRKPRLPPIDKV